MNISVNWLSALLGEEIDAEDAAQQLAMLVSSVDAIEPVHRDLDDVVVGLVKRVEKHPDADRLSLCFVDTGSGTAEVVCGASNVVAGNKYPFAPDGAVLPGGVKLKARKVRGVLSNGMLCSARELGLGEDQEGILELATDALPGTRLNDVLQVADYRLILEVMPNRPDLLCHKGVARELGAVSGLPVKLPKIEGAPDTSKPRRVGGSGTVDGIDVVLEDVEGCPRYVAAVIRGVKVGPSPDWLQARLRSVGSRPINNVVDASNYIMFELNQPTHAFDLSLLGGRKVVIRRARANEALVTLDGEERKLSPEMTAICDAERPVAIGGVMGGSNSEVSGATTDILLECAYFDPKRIRATRTALKMNTEASYRFERGTDFLGMSDALRRAVGLIIAVADGKEPEAAVDLNPKPRQAPTVFLRPERVEKLLGVSIPRTDIEQHLARVGFTIVPKDDRLAVQVPGWRPDVSREVDLIEEVARLRGYDRFPADLRPFQPSAVPDDPGEKLKAATRRLLTGLGLHEARTLSLGPPGASGAPAILNPLSLEEAHLRTELIPGLLRSAQHNWSVRVRDIRLFEIGIVFRSSTTEGGRPDEILRVAGIVTGARSPSHWSAPSGAADFDQWDLKSIFEAVASRAGPEGELTGSESGWHWRDSEGVLRGWARELPTDRPAWAAMVYGFELDMDVRERAPVRYGEIPIRPPLERDIALVVPGDVTAERVGSVIRRSGGALLESAFVFDEYRASDIAGRSLAWRLIFRAPERTLRDKDADLAVDRILKVLREELGVELRQS